jgi:hypothetical protein
MESFKAFGRNWGAQGRKGRKNAKRNEAPRIEFLEERRLLTSSSPYPSPVWTPTDTNLFDAQNGPMANLGTGLVSVYTTFVNSEGSTAELATEYPDFMFQNGMVGVQLKSLGGDFSQYQTQLTDAGVQITTASATYGLVDGYAPVNALPTIAELPQTEAGQVAYAPLVYASSGGEYQGVAYNESETPIQADVARTEFGINGSGVTVGVLSDSVNQYDGGLSESYGTGDLNPDNPVDVLQDDSAANYNDDEGRAMLENIHDIAPGANLSSPRAP